MRELLHIVLDIDRVLVDFMGGLLPHISAALGREVREEHLTEYYFQPALGIAPDVWAEIWAAHEDRLYAEAMPYPGVSEGVAALAALARLSIQTGRPQRAMDATSAWLRRNIPVPIDVHCRSDGAKYTTADCVDFFIEDNLSMVFRAESGRAILVDRPWNRTGAPPHARRVRTLLEAAAVIESELRTDAARRRAGGARS